MEKLNLNVVGEMVDRTPVQGLCVVQNYTKQPTKNGGFYYGGVLSTADGTIDFKSWSNSSAFSSLEEGEVKDAVCEISGEVNVYNGTKSLIVQHFRVIDEATLSNLGLSIVDFLYSKYNVNAYYEKYVGLLSKNLSDKGELIFNKVMEKYGDRFKSEFAAIYYHDNCRGGLLAHSLKVCQIASVVSLYPNILDRVGKDLLYLGCAFHDIGKILEYNYGDMSDIGRKVSHTVLGAYLIASEFEDLISDNMGSSFFYDLLSILSCHHGENGEPPRTVAAYVVHLLDVLDSRLTGLNAQLEGIQKGDVCQFDGFKLS